MYISLVIPTYNEAENIPILIDRIFSVFGNNNLEGVFLMADGFTAGATDKPGVYSFLGLILIFGSLVLNFFLWWLAQQALSSRPHNYLFLNHKCSFYP